MAKTMQRERARSGMKRKPPGAKPTQSSGNEPSPRRKKTGRLQWPIALSVLAAVIILICICLFYSYFETQSREPSTAARHGAKAKSGKAARKTGKAMAYGAGDAPRKSKGKSPTITPDWIADQIHALMPQLDMKRLGREMAERQQQLADREAAIKQAKQYGYQGNWRNASQLLKHVLEYNPFDEDAKRLLFTCYKHLYPTGPGGTAPINLTQSYVQTTRRHAKRGWALAHGRNITVRRLHDSVHAYVMENFLSDNECLALQGEHHRIQDKYDVHPLVCFQNNAFLQHPRLQHHFIPGTFCFGQAISAALAPLLKWSTSSGCHREESGLATLVENRIDSVVGLPERHGYNLQLLSYPTGVSYNDHTDCSLGQCGAASEKFNDRHATFLVYLNEVDGGELSFTKLNVKVAPKCGRAVAFLGYSNDCCNGLSMHRSEMVALTETGRKMAVQKWYTYRDIPYMSERHRRPAIKELLPYQPVVSCDYIPDGGETSCRWYDFWPFADK